jgi:hypothetical protein
LPPQVTPIGTVQRGQRRRQWNSRGAGGDRGDVGRVRRQVGADRLPRYVEPLRLGVGELALGDPRLAGAADCAAVLSISSTSCW